MEETMRMDIRRLLKTFGIQADEAIISHVARNPGSKPINIKISLEDITDYGDDLPDRPLKLEIQGVIRRNE